jgi:hypothetical protein
MLHPPIHIQIATLKHPSARRLNSRPCTARMSCTPGASATSADPFRFFFTFPFGSAAGSDICLARCNASTSAWSKPGTGAMLPAWMETARMPLAASRPSSVKRTLTGLLQRCTSGGLRLLMLCRHALHFIVCSLTVYMLPYLHACLYTPSQLFGCSACSHPWQPRSLCLSAVL